MRNQHLNSTLVIRLMVTMLLSGCAVGPDFKPPSAPTTETYTPEPLPLETVSTDVRGGEAQRFRVGNDLPGEWWKLFGSTKLDALIREAMMSYPDIAAQQAALRAARQNVQAGMGVFYPQIQGIGNGTRERVGGASIGPGFPGFITNVFQASVDVSYTFDVFGGERRQIEGLRAQADAQDCKLKSSFLALTANVVSTVIQLASVGDQIMATRHIVAIENKQLAVVQRQYSLGSRTRADVLQQQSNLATVRGTLPALQQQQAVAEHQLVILLGRSPSDALNAEFELNELHLPRDLPISLPSSLVAQRPDIRFQEMLMRQASASIGVATANMLPQLTLTGAYGGEALDFGKLVSAGSGTWNIAAGITAPLFEGGALRAKRRAAFDTYDQVSAQYRMVVLQAFANVADSLTALDNDAQALKAEYEAVNAAKDSLALIERQFDHGAVSYVSLLTAQQIFHQTRIAYIRAIASRYADTVVLFQALGGGWWNRRDQGTSHVARADSPSWSAKN